MKRPKKIDAGSLAQRKRARIPMPRPVERHVDKKKDYIREKKVDIPVKED